METSINFKNLTTNLSKDNVFVNSTIVPMEQLTGLVSRKGLEMGIIVQNGEEPKQLINVVSKNYGHLPNEVFFKEIERNLAEQGIGYVRRSINRGNASFAVDYILNDDTLVTKVSKSIDKIVPMLRFITSYDGSCKTSGHIAIFRQVCTNGLHVSKSTDIGFKFKHKGNIVEICLPAIADLVNNFMNNEYYNLSRKFEVLAETPIANLEDFVKQVATDTNLFKYEKSDKNPAPSLNAETIIATIKKEAGILGVTPNLWLGYNAFNELLHDKLKKNFQQQSDIDVKLFEYIAEMA